MAVNDDRRNVDAACEEIKRIHKTIEELNMKRREDKQRTEDVGEEYKLMKRKTEELSHD